MHSSRMHTVHCSDCLMEGVSAHGGVCLGGVCPGVGGCLPRDRGMSAWGSCLPRRELFAQEGSA